MTAQVIFIHTGYYPTFEESLRLFNQQEKLTSSLIELSFATRSYSHYERYLAKERYHNGFRERWKIFTGFGLNNQKLLENQSDLG
jgi:hypothetical protein